VSKTDELIEQIRLLKFRIFGNPENNDDDGLEGISQDHEFRISTLEKSSKRWSAVALSVFIALCTWFITELKDDGNDNIDNHNNHPHIMDNGNETHRGEENDNIHNSKPN